MHWSTTHRALVVDIVAAILAEMRVAAWVVIPIGSVFPTNTANLDMVVL